MANSSASNSGAELHFGTVAPTGTDYNDNASFVVTDDGTAAGTPSEFHKFDGETQSWVSIPLGGGASCPAPMTRSQLLSLSGSYSKDCHYVITDFNRGTVGPALIEMHAVDADTLSNNVSVKTTHDNMAWSGIYDINANHVFELHDNESNRVKGESAVESFPWGAASVTQNTVDNAILDYTAGTVQLNTFTSGSDVTVNGGSVTFNTISGDSQVVVNGGNVNRNNISQQSNVTVDSGDFRENTIFGDAVVTSSTSGDVENNEFGSLSIINISGGANVDTVTVSKNSNLTISGGSFLDSTIDEDAEVVLYGGSHYENHFGTSVVFRQVSGTTAYLRYCTIEGSTTWTNGQVNLSNVSSYTATVNTTGSSGTISNSTLNRAVMSSAQNIASLTITDTTFSDYAQLSANNATRVYLYRSNFSSGGRVLLSAGATLNASYSGIRDYGYFRATQGTLTANYSSAQGGGYIDQTSTGSNQANYTHVSCRANVRFLDTTNNCRVNYCSVSSNSQVYHSGTSTGCYFYYCNADAYGRMYSTNSQNLRCYYSAATSFARIFSNESTGTHYIYYCSSRSNSQIEMRTCTGSRIYSVDVSAQSIARLQNSGTSGRLYYSSFTAYYYLYVTLTATRSALHAYGRKTNTVSDPANGTAVENF